MASGATHDMTTAPSVASVTGACSAIDSAGAPETTGPSVFQDASENVVVPPTAMVHATKTPPVKVVSKTSSLPCTRYLPAGSFREATTVDVVPIARKSGRLVA